MSLKDRKGRKIGRKYTRDSNTYNVDINHIELHGQNIKLEYIRLNLIQKIVFIFECNGRGCVIDFVKTVCMTWVKQKQTNGQKQNDLTCILKNQRFSLEAHL